MRHVITRALIIAVGVSVHAGCAGLTHGPSSRFYVNRDPGNQELTLKNGQTSPDAPPQPTLEEAIGKVRRLMAEARPEQKPAVTATIEGSDPELAAALAAATIFPTAESFVEVGRAYHRKQLLDKAYDYYTRALKLKPKHANAHEGLARVWRDWGSPALALGDIQRAIYYAPWSASARNTLGTILQALSQRTQARAAYKLALTFDPSAAYALNNLCYLSFLDGDAERAVAECNGAIKLNPGMSAARNNLGLTYAAAGRLDLAREQFDLAGGPTASAYNMGVVHLADRRFAAAAEEFRIAQRISPNFADAGRRALYAHRRAAADSQSQGGK